jgi:hypothetical protein
LRAMTEGHRDLLPLCVWKASSSNQYWNLTAAWVREARAVAPGAPLSLRMLDQDLVATGHKSSHMVGKLCPSSSCGACSPALRKSLGRGPILR